MKLEIGKLSYDILDFEEQLDITEYNPQHVYKGFLTNNNYSNDSFVEVQHELEINDNIIKIITDDNQIVTKQLINLINYYYDFGNNALVFAIEI